MENMKALITGASSGLGWDMAHILSEMGYEILAVARREEKLKELQAELKTPVEILCCDVTDEAVCHKLAERADEVDILINNAGFGVFGDFCSTELKQEMAMLDTNVRALHMLTKLFVKKFKERDHGYILNVASLAAFFPGPLFGAYYATKAYVLRLSQAIAEELRREKSKAKISVLCPGPVHTEFGTVAKVQFGTGKEEKTGRIVLTSRDVAEYAIRKMLAGKQVIIPGWPMRVAASLRRVLPDKMLARVVFLIQSKKCLKK
jgi:short-subunit dehydrogenase